MATKKTTGKKLADMMYGNPEGAAFGITPMIGKRREDRQDREAAKSFPVDLARGVVAGAAGMPGDIESLIRMFPGLDERTILPTSEDVLKRIPFGTDTPAGRFASGLGTLAGGSAPIGPAIRGAKALPGALSRAQDKAVQAGMKLERGMEPVVNRAMERGGLPREMVMAMGANAQSNVIKPKGGNWLGGNLMGNMDENVRRLKPYKKAGAQADFLQKDLVAYQASLDRLKNDKYASPQMVQAQQDVVDNIKKKIAINNWVESNLGKYVKNQMATPEDPIRLLLDKRTKEIEAKHAKDMERAERVAQRAMDESDPRRQANMIRESERLKIEANVERQFAMDSVIPSRMQDYSPDADQYLKQRRQEAGFPAEGMGESEAAKRYETLTDDAISTMRAGDVQEMKVILAQAQDAERAYKTLEPEILRRFEERIRSAGLNESEVASLMRNTPMMDKAAIIQDVEYQTLKRASDDLSANLRRDEYAAGQQNPFIDKLDPETQLYSGNTADMGFDHVIDILKQDVMEGRIRPEQLSKVSVEDAVRRTMDFDQEAAKKMAEAQIKNMEGFPVYKEYPEGYRWVELKKPEDLPEGYSLDDMGNVVDEKGHITNHPGEKRLEEALKYEGDTMGHCVGGYCPDVLEGKSRIYSLRDARGEPHVTVEVNPSSQRVAPRHEEIVSEMKSSGLNLDQLDESAYDAAYEQALQRVKQNRPPAIAQIKGKQNAAPKAEYLPYVQDFVKSGKYSEVGDLENTGLYSARDVMNYMPENFTMSRNARQLAVGRARMAGEMPDYMTKAEYEAMLQKHAPEDIWSAEKAQRAAEDDELLRQLQPPEDGMARGGPVHFSNNPDVMALELAAGGAVRMQAGGLVKGIKALKAAAKAEKELALPPVLPRAPAKTKEEIRPYAQRMAQQMTGEFYRPNPKKSENVAGKSFSQFKMEKGLEHDIRPTREVVEPEVADIEKQLGMLKIGISGDTTIADKVLRRAGPYELFDPSPQHGGPRYGLGGEGAWASNNPIAATVQKRVNELSEAYGAPPLGQYMAMGPQGSNFAQHFADANLQAIDTSAMTKSQIEQINKLIREGSQKSGPRPSFPGIEDRGSAYLHFAIDPELRKHFNDLMQKTSVTEKLNLPDGRIILHAITEPELRDKEILNTGFSQMRLKSAFDPEALQISAHPTYSHVIPHEEGSAVTRTKYLTPGELEFSDVLDYAKQHYRPQDMTRVFQTSTPRQIVDPQHIDEMKMYEELMKEYTGKKAGGEVKAPAAQIDGNQFVLAAQKYGLDDDISTLNKMVGLVNQGATVEEAARIVSQTSAQKSGSGKIDANDEQQVQNPVHFTENPDAMRLELTKRN
jgi:hypothetical protein